MPNGLEQVALKKSPDDWSCSFLDYCNWNCTIDQTVYVRFKDSITHDQGNIYCGMIILFIGYILQNYESNSSASLITLIKRGFWKTLS